VTPLTAFMTSTVAMDLESITGAMAEFIEANSTMINGRDAGSINGQIMPSTEENLSKDTDTARAHTHLQTAPCILENGPRDVIME